MSSLFSKPKVPKVGPARNMTPAREMSGESAYRARDERRRAAGATGRQSTLVALQSPEKKSILG